MSLPAKSSPFEIPGNSSMATNQPDALYQSPDNQRLISVYLRTLTSPQTKRTYNTEINRFISFLSNELGKEIREVTIEDLSLYRERVLERYSSATAAKKLTVVRRFLTFTYMGGITAVNPEALRFFAKSPRVQQDSSYNILTSKEVVLLLNAARSKNQRDYVMLTVMVACGLREAEVVSLKIGDLTDIGDGQAAIRVLGKGDKVRNVSISTELWSLLQRYVLSTKRSFASRADTAKPLFVSREGQDRPLTTRSIRYIVKKYARAAGITKPISPHSIRHTVGTNMAVNEAPLLVIQQFLGHSDPKTTLRYIRRAEELASKAYTYNTLPVN